jgi:23S rRNA (pseudouridine1915-N3)-methyltransferase
MELSIVAVGTRLEPWLNDAFEHYRRRLPPHLKLRLEEIPLARRTAAKKGEVGRAAPIEEEGQRLLKRVRPGAYAVLLDERGREFDSAGLAQQLSRWLEREPQVALLVGGPDGVSKACRERAAATWSLSRLTLPHGLVRVLVAEQIYRAWTILQGHPYHLGHLGHLGHRKARRGAAAPNGSGR